MGVAGLKALVFGRIGRGRYLLYSLAAFAAFHLVTLWGSDTTAALLLPLVWVPFVGARRLRDFGRSGWWALTPFLAGVVVGALGVVVRNSGGGGAGWTDLLLLLVSFGFLLFLALKKGDPGPNRFGEARAAF